MILTEDFITQGGIHQAEDHSANPLMPSRPVPCTSATQPAAQPLLCRDAGFLWRWRGVGGALNSHIPKVSILKDFLHYGQEGLGTAISSRY